MEHKIDKIEAIVGRPILYVDFNEQLDEGVYFISQNDTKKDIHDNEIHLEEGLRIVAYMDDYNELNERDDLFGLGIIIPNNTGHSTHVKWFVEIEGNEIRHVGEFSF